MCTCKSGMLSCVIDHILEWCPNTDQSYGRCCGCPYPQAVRSSPEAWCAERRYHIYKVVKALKHLPQNVLEPPDGAPALLLKFIGELGNCTRILNTP